MIFEKSEKLLMEAEHIVLDKKERDSSFVGMFGSFLYRHLWFPCKILWKGFNIAIYDWQKFTIMFMVFAFVIVFLNDYLDMQHGSFKAVSGALIIIWMFYALFSTIFSTPSTIPKYGVEKEDIKKLISKINELNIDSLELDAVSKNIKLFEESLKKRVIFIRVLLAFIFGVNTFQPTLVSLLEHFSNGWVLLAFVSVELYNKGVTHIFKTIEFTVCEIETNNKIKKSNRKY